MLQVHPLSWLVSFYISASLIVVGHVNHPCSIGILIGNTCYHITDPFYHLRWTVRRRIVVYGWWSTHPFWCIATGNIIFTRNTCILMYVYSLSHFSTVIFTIRTIKHNFIFVFICDSYVGCLDWIGPPLWDSSETGISSVRGLSFGFMCAIYFPTPLSFLWLSDFYDMGLMIFELLRWIKWWSILLLIRSQEPPSVVTTSTTISHVAWTFYSMDRYCLISYPCNETLNCSNSSMRWQIDFDGFADS